MRRAIDAETRSTDKFAFVVAARFTVWVKHEILCINTYKVTLEAFDKHSISGVLFPVKTFFHNASKHVKSDGGNSNHSVHSLPIIFKVGQMLPFLHISSLLVSILL